MDPTRRTPVDRASFRNFGLLLLLVTMIAGGCGGTRRAADNSGYALPIDTPSGADTAPLNGRVIVLDPGHGGFFEGVVGLNGLSEADANLGVALYLRGLLEWAGAEVHLTRSTDIDFLTPADSSLAIDLQARMAMVDSLQPDILLSLHHNSNAALDRDMNETQTYYPVGRDGADLDLARAIHKHLSRSLRIQPAKIMAGNFYMLRNSPVPAVLGEPSMLSNPAVEGKLFRAEKLELEAKAYFLGILEYFADGTPYWQPLAAVESLAAPQPAWRFIPDPAGDAPRLDPSTVQLKRDGIIVPHVLNPDGETVLATAIENQGLRLRTYEIFARNLAGRATQSPPMVYGKPPTARELVLTRITEGALATPRRALIFWDLLDVGGNPVVAAGPLVIGPQNLTAATPAVTTLTSGGEASGVFFEGESMTVSDEWLATGNIDARQSGSINRGHGADLGDGRTWCILLTPAGALSRTPLINRYPGAVSPYQRPYAVPMSPEAPIWLESRGNKPLVRTPVMARRDTLVMASVLPELCGRTVVIDPTGGGTETDGTGPLGITGSEINLQVARRLARLLEGCGATVVLTRVDTRYVPAEEKVLMANRRAADLFLTIGRNGTGTNWQLLHHYNSGGGTRWAQTLREASAHLAAPDSAVVAESYAYLLRHTPCVALSCLMPGPLSVAREERLASPTHQQAVALVLLRSIRDYFAESSLALAVLDIDGLLQTHRAHFPAPADLDLIIVDGHLMWLPGPSAPVVPITGPEHILEIRAGDRWWLKTIRVTGREVEFQSLLAGRGDRIGTLADFEPPREETTYDR